jgi:hypothetical protein
MGVTMQRFEYKIVPAPKKAIKQRGLKTTEDRFARTLTDAVNLLAVEGWEYLRADTLPVEERVGLTGRTTTFQHMLVFRRALDVPQIEAAPAAAPRPLELSSLFADHPDQDIAPTTIAAIRAQKDNDVPSAIRLVTLPQSGEAPPLGPPPGKNHAAE